MRLIQRFGRVDRIGSTHSEIYLHNMWPDLEVDEELALTDRLNNRIQMFHDLIGLDNRLLSDVERVNNQNMYRIYEVRNSLNWMTNSMKYQPDSERSRCCSASRETTLNCGKL